MARNQVVFHATYGHVHRPAEAVAEGAREVSGRGAAWPASPRAWPAGDLRPYRSVSSRTRARSPIANRRSRAPRSRLR
jgi:hypothetical protein